MNKKNFEREKDNESDKLIDRRAFLGASASTFLLGWAPPSTAWARKPPTSRQRSSTPKSTFKLWVFSDAHVGTDIKFGRESLAEALRQSEFGGTKEAVGLSTSVVGQPFDWDIALALGDFSGAPGTPTDDEGREVVRQLGVLRKHVPEDIYTIAGNHDATPYTEGTQWWFRKWIDPMGENSQYSGINSSRRRYPTVGTWERYYFRVGNILFLMMSDRNDLPPPIGRHPEDVGGYPAGAITMDTFQWWRDMIEKNPDSIIVSAHHHMIKDTTTASGPWEGFERSEDGTVGFRYHGYFPKGVPAGASYLYFVGDKPDAGLIEDYLQKNPGKLDFWLGGHTHLYPSLLQGDRAYLERKWGTTFINCSALARHHVERPPSSRLITFQEGSDEAKVELYLHTNDAYFQGWFSPQERLVPLSKKFSLST